MNQETDVSSTSMFGTAAGCKLKMRHWLVVQTDTKAYPGLRWLDEEKTLLRIPWKHGSNGGWNVQDGKLFENWAFYSGKFDPTRPKNSRKFKANFRCALRSLSDVIEVKEKSRKTGKDACKVFKFLEEKRRRPVGSLKTSTAITTAASVTSGGSNLASSSTSSPGSQRSHATAAESDRNHQSTFANCHNNHFIFNNYIAAPVATASATLAASALMEMRRQSAATDHIPPPCHPAHGSGKLEYSTGSGQYSAMLSASSTTEYDRHHYHYYHHYFNGASGYTNGNAVVAGGGNGLDSDWRDITEFLKEEAEQMTYNRSYYNFQ